MQSSPCICTMKSPKEVPSADSAGASTLIPNEFSSAKSQFSAGKPYMIHSSQKLDPHGLSDIPEIPAYQGLTFWDHLDPLFGRITSRVIYMFRALAVPLAIYYLLVYITIFGHLPLVSGPPKVREHKYVLSEANCLQMKNGVWLCDVSVAPELYKGAVNETMTKAIKNGSMVWRFEPDWRFTDEWKPTR